MTKADKGVAPASAGAAPVVISASTSCISLVSSPEHAPVRNTLSEYLDGTLETGLRQRVDEHLRACRDCTAFLRTLRATVDVVHRLPELKAPPAGIARVLEQARREAAARPDA